MLKILLLLGGVWFSLAFLFVLALVAAAGKSVPQPDSIESPRAISATESQAGTSVPAQSGGRKFRWQIWKPVRA
jgi:hypothetical protein